VMGRLHKLVRASTPARPVALVRVLVGAMAAFKAVDMWFTVRLLPDPAVMRAPYVEWVPYPGRAGAVALVAAWFVAAVCLTVGWRTRIAGGVLLLLLGYTLALDRQLYSNHLYLLAIVVLLLTLADAGADLSFDARRSAARTTIPAWPVTLLKAMVPIVYGYAAVAKLNSDYLSSAVLSVYLRREGPLALPEVWHTPAALVPLAAASVAAEAFVAWGLFWRRTRPAAVAVGLAVHAGMVALLPLRRGITIFSVVTVSLYLLFVETGGRAGRRLRLSPEAPAPPRSATPPASPPGPSGPAARSG
jgi:vitamin K-dependent gamma-carboxylase